MVVSRLTGEWQWLMRPLYRLFLRRTRVSTGFDTFTTRSVPQSPGVTLMDKQRREQARSTERTFADSGNNTTAHEYHTHLGISVVSGRQDADLLGLTASRVA
jgi:hypothetical protein